MKAYIAKISSVEVHTRKYVNSLLGTKTITSTKIYLLPLHFEESIHKAISIQKPSWIVLRGTALLLKHEQDLIRKSLTILFQST